MQENISGKSLDVHTFEIKGTYHKDNCLPTLNDMLAQATRHPLAYNDLKKDMEFITIRAIRKDLKGWRATKRVRLDITWGEKAKGNLRDWDNVVAAGRKIINDALVKTSTLEDDNPRYLGYGTNTFVYTDSPFVRVEIVEIDEFKK